MTPSFLLVHLLWVQVESLLLVPKRREVPLAVAAAGESVYLLGPEREPSLLHSVYGHPITCLDVTPSHVALGVKRHGWAVSDGGNKVGWRAVVMLPPGGLELPVQASRLQPFIESA